MKNNEESNANEQPNTASKLHLYNTLSRQIEEFKPINPDNIRIYSCGPTVYHYAHLGNMRAYVFADILQRTIKTIYPTVSHVINITDVGHIVDDADAGEDKIEKGSRRENKSAWDIAKYYTDAYMSDLIALGIDTDNYIFPRATEYIAEQIKMVKTLSSLGYTYTTNTGIYFDTSKVNDYGYLARLDTKNLNAGERVDMGDKKNKTDFALWKFSPKGEERQMQWIYSGDRAGMLITADIASALTADETADLGFPGWHIECSAMSEALLGEHFDIHTGGIDHIPVHHTNEIAQSTCAHDGEKFVNYWCHVNFLNDKTGKMSKSNGDFLRIQTLVEGGYSPASYRYMLLATHYRKEIEFSYESLAAAETALKKLQKYMHNEAKNNQNIIDATKYRINNEWYNKFLSAIYDDLNTSRAIAVIWEMINESNKLGIEANNKSDDTLHTYSTILKMNKVLGLDLSYSENKITFDADTQNRINELLEKRKAARAIKDWATSDALREEIQALGFEVTD